jgi:hypothetical protein
MEKKIPSQLNGWVNGKEYADYNDVVSCFGTIVMELNDDDYQGDERYLLEKNGKYGYTIIGFGSCSGCDWLQGCSTKEEKIDLILEIERDIKWFKSLDDIKKYFKEKDWELEYSWHQKETKEFINKVLNFN